LLPVALAPAGSRTDYDAQSNGLTIYFLASGFKVKDETIIADLKKNIMQKRIPTRFRLESSTEQNRQSGFSLIELMYRSNHFRHCYGAMAGFLEAGRSDHRLTSESKQCRMCEIPRNWP